MLVCRRDDRNDWPSGFQVLELHEVVTLKKRQGMFVTLEEGYPAPWNDDTFFAAAGRDGTDAADIALAREIIRLAKEHKWGPIWLVNPKPVFAVGTPQFFKVDSRGRIGFPFSRLRAEDVFAELADRLNEAVPALGLQPGDGATKSRGGQLSELFRSDQQVQKFFKVWLWLTQRVMPNSACSRRRLLRV